MKIEIQVDIQIDIGRYIDRFDKHINNFIVYKTIQDEIKDRSIKGKTGRIMKIYISL